MEIILKSSIKATELRIASRLATQFDDRVAELRAAATSTSLRNEPEDRHQFRVLIRNLRAINSIARSAGLPVSDRVRESLKWVGEPLGKLRDADVQLELLEKQVAESGEDSSTGTQILMGRYRRLRGLRLAIVRRRLKSAQFKQALSELEGTTREWDPAAADSKAEKSVLKLLDKRYRRVKKLAKRVERKPGPGRIHDFRVSLKKFRYTVENVSDSDTKPVKRYIKCLRKAQDRLGEHQDLVVFRESLLDFGDEGAEAELATAIAAVTEKKAAKSRKRPGKVIDPVTGKRWKAARKAIAKSL